MIPETVWEEHIYFGVCCVCAHGCMCLSVCVCVCADVGTKAFVCCWFPCVSTTRPLEGGSPRACLALSLNRTLSSVAPSLLCNHHSYFLTIFSSLWPVHRNHEISAYNTSWCYLLHAIALRVVPCLAFTWIACTALFRRGRYAGRAWATWVLWEEAGKVSLCSRETGSHSGCPCLGSPPFLLSTLLYWSYFPLR